jgi:hypothetical protein
MSLLSPQTQDEARNAGTLVYELILSNWGNWGEKRDPQNGSIQFPPASFDGISIPIGTEGLSGVYGVAISPRSDVDRCILQYNTNKKPSLPKSDPRFLNNGGILDAETKVAVGTAYIGQLMGPIIVRADPAHWFADTYIPANIATPAPPPAFGTALGETFVAPALRLVLNLSSATAFPPGRRSPLFIEFAYPFDDTEVGTEVLLRVIPIMGRRHVRATFVASGGTGPGSDVEVLATGTFPAITAGAPPANPVPDVAAHEFPLDGPVTVDADSNGTASFQINHPQASFLLLKATPSVAGVTLNVAVEALD